MKKLYTLLLAAACFTVSAQTVSDLDLVYDSDSTRFLVASTPMTWNDAQAYAESLGGHLATFSDAAENVNVAALLPPAPNEGYWIGLVQEASGTEPNDGWHWISGETLSFTFWSNEEPSDDANTDADCGECDEGSGAWNDAPCSFFRRFILEVSNEGCTDSESCNYNAFAIVDDGNCHYDCQFCLEGTVWSEELGGCVVANVSDTDFDGCVGINDFLVHLSNFGSGCGPESAWSCGDPLEYQGYDYETVQIGEQCWFAENLRSESYKNGDVIPSDLDDAVWTGGYEGATAAYDLEFYGRLYNWYAVDDQRGLCPDSWHVSTNEDWAALESEIVSQGHLGTEGRALKATYGWLEGGAGTDLYGFSALPGGARHAENGLLYNQGFGGDWWTPSSQHLFLLQNSDMIGEGMTDKHFGFSVRCIKDTE